MVSKFTLFDNKAYYENNCTEVYYFDMPKGSAKQSSVMPSNFFLNMEGRYNIFSVRT